MAWVKYRYRDGSTSTIEVAAGTSVMKGAVSQGIDGIVGECGGQAMCATCHVYVDEHFLDVLPEMSEDEEEMLEDTAAPLDAARSRLGCQLKLGLTLESIVVDIPEEQ